MAKKKRKNIFLITALLSLLLGIGLIYFLPPSYAFAVFTLTIPISTILFFLIFLFLYSLTAYLFRSFLHGILVGLFPVVYLLMRLSDLKSPLFFVLLAGIFIGLEIFLVQITAKRSK